MFKRIAKAFAIIALGFGLAACGERVEVPSAAVGKIMTKDGYKPGVVSTSKFRLDQCFVYCDKIVLLSVADLPIQESMKLFMPKDKLNMDFTLQATLSMKEASYDDMFARIRPVDVKDSDEDWIPQSEIYKTYAQQIIRSEAREFLSQYTINDIASNLEAVNSELSKRLADSINKKTPYQVRYIGLANLQYPPIIVEAQENAAKRTEMIRQEQAQQELSKVSLERQLQEQRMQRQIDVEKAEADAQVARIQSDAITPKYLSYRGLDVMEKLANSQNKVFVPTSMLDSIAAQIQLAK